MRSQWKKSQQTAHESSSIHSLYGEPLLARPVPFEEQSSNQSPVSLAASSDNRPDSPHEPALLSFPHLLPREDRTRISGRSPTTRHAFVEASIVDDADMEALADSSDHDEACGGQEDERWKDASSSSLGLIAKGRDLLGVRAVDHHSHHQSLMLRPDGDIGQAVDKDADHDELAGAPSPVGPCQLQSLDTLGDEEQGVSFHDHQLTACLTTYPELAASSFHFLTRIQGLKFIIRLSMASTFYSLSGALPPFLSLLCLLFSDRPNAVEETGAFALGVAVSNLLWGPGLSMGSGMDLRSSRAAINGMWHVSWKLLTKTLCVSTWFMILTLGPMLLLQASVGLPTSLFVKVVGVSVGGITTSVVTISSLGFLANFYFEACHRFLSYQRCSNAQTVLVVLSGLVHSLLLVLLVWRAAYGPITAAALTSSVACLRMLALGVYIHWRRYELGWQSGVRVKLFERQRPGQGRGRARGLGGGVSGKSAGQIETPLRRQKRFPTGRPDAKLTHAISSLQQTKETSRFDFLHPISAAAYSAKKEIERINTLEKEAETWYFPVETTPQPPPFTAEGVSPQSVKPEPAAFSLGLPSAAFTGGDLGISRPGPDAAVSVNGSRRSSRLDPLESQSKTIIEHLLDASFHQPTDPIERRSEHISCFLGQQRDARELDTLASHSSGSPIRSRLLASPKAKRAPSRPPPPKANTATEFTEQQLQQENKLTRTSSGCGSPRRAARRMCKKLAKRAEDDMDIEKKLATRPFPPPSLSPSCKVESLSTQQSLKLFPHIDPAVPRRKRANTVVLERLVSVNNSLILDGCCLPTALSWNLYWGVQGPRQFAETKDFLFSAIPSALILSHESLSFDLLIVMSSILGPTHLALFSFLLTLNHLLSAIPLSVATSMAEPLYLTMQVDNSPHAKVFLKTAARLTLYVAIVNALVVIGLGACMEFPFFSELNHMPHSVNSSTGRAAFLAELPSLLPLLGLISIADCMSILFTTVLRHIGFIVSSLIATSLILVLSMPLTMLLGITVFHCSTLWCLSVVLVHVVLLCVVSFFQLIQSPILTAGPLGAQPQVSFHFLSLKTFRRGPTECRSLFNGGACHSDVQLD